MSDDAEFDEYLMTVVETALQKPREERAEYLRLACAGNDELYKEAQERVMWEERMAGFLADPLINTEPINTEPVRDEPATTTIVPKASATSRRIWLAAPVALAVLLIGWRLFLAPGGAPVRLAILPFIATRIQQHSVKAIAIDVERRLTSSRRNFEILTPLEPNQQFQSVDEASQFGATHVLQVEMEQEHARSILREVMGGKVIFNVDKNYGEHFDLADDIVAGISRAFSLQVLPGVSRVAYNDYLNGLALLRKDNSMALRAFIRAMELDKSAIDPKFGAAEAEWMRYVGGDGRDALDRAAVYLNNGKAIQPDCVALLILSGLYQVEYGNYERAIKELEQAVRIDPANRDAWQTLVMAQLALGKPDAAVASSRAALDTNPESYWPYLLREGLFERQQKPGEAVRVRQDLRTKLPRIPSDATLKSRYKDQ